MLQKQKLHYDGQKTDTNKPLLEILFNRSLIKPNIIYWVYLIADADN
jgi:hypothetical protein